jgi:serine/threonine protein kinase
MSTAPNQRSLPKGPKGTHLGPYEFASSIGVGSMGEVFRARDTRLNRDVAVKILPKGFVPEGDPPENGSGKVSTALSPVAASETTIHIAVQSRRYSASWT